MRVLVWAGSPLPLFHPTRSDVRDAIDTLTRGTRIRCEPDPREHPIHCHHEKTICIDGEVAFVGGIDLTDDSGDRFDASAHAARRRLGWHDVGTRLRGPAVADVARPLRHALARGDGRGASLAPRQPAEAGQSTVQVVRTVAEDMYDEVPRGDFRILESYIRALRSARRFIYLENQFLWSPRSSTCSSTSCATRPPDDFRWSCCCRPRPTTGRTTPAASSACSPTPTPTVHDRFLAATIRSLSGERDDPLYVHAKVGIVDDRWLTVGSANLNAHSLLNDTEMNVVTDDADLARRTRVRLWAEHLELDEETVAASDPVTLVDEHWRPIAYEQLGRRDAGAPPTHRLLALPGVSKRSRRLLGPLQNLADDA